MITITETKQLNKTRHADSEIVISSNYRDFNSGISTMTIAFCGESLF